MCLVNYKHAHRLKAHTKNSVNEYQCVSALCHALCGLILYDIHYVCSQLHKHGETKKVTQLHKDIVNQETYIQC